MYVCTYVRTYVCMYVASGLVFPTNNIYFDKKTSSIIVFVKGPRSNKKKKKKKKKRKKKKKKKKKKRKKKKKKKRKKRKNRGLILFIERQRNAI